MALLRRFDARATCDDVVEGVDLSGRVALVTGSNSGLGFETARALAKARARVIVACRTQEKAEDTVERLRALQPDADLKPLGVELGSRRSIHEAASLVSEPELHLLVCNAGLFRGAYSTTADGFEETVGVCHLGHFLLFNLLRPRLERARGSRVVVVSSEAHRMAKTLDFDSLVSTRASFRAYGVAKLCNVLFASELTHRHGDQGITGVSLHPGALLPTQIARHSLSSRLVTQCARPFTKSVPQGAAMTVYCATASDEDAPSGSYLIDYTAAEPSEVASQREIADALWERSASLVGLR